MKDIFVIHLGLSNGQKQINTNYTMELGKKMILIWKLYEKKRRKMSKSQR